jgi:hypothetical protein
MSDHGEIFPETPPEEVIVLYPSDDELESPTGGYESDAPTVHDFEDLFGELPHSMHRFYTNRENLRDLYGLTDIEMNELLLENEVVNGIAEEYESECYNPLKKQAEEADKGNRTGDVDIDINIGTMIDILVDYDKAKYSFYTAPLESKKRKWTPQDWFLGILVYYENELCRLKILPPPKYISPRSAYIWAYLLLKAKEVLCTNPAEHEKATVALAKARENRDRPCQEVEKQMEPERAHFGHLPLVLRSKAFTDFKGFQRNSSPEAPSEGKSTSAHVLEEDQTLGLLREHARKRKMDDPGSDQGETEADFTRNSKKMKK